MGQGLNIVALGKAAFTASSPKDLVLKSNDSELISAPAAEKWISLCTPFF